MKIMKNNIKMCQYESEKIKKENIKIIISILLVLWCVCNDKYCENESDKEIMKYY